MGWAQCLVVAQAALGLACGTVPEETPCACLEGMGVCLLAARQQLGMPGSARAVLSSTHSPPRTCCCGRCLLLRLQVFVHIPMPYQAHHELFRILKPGGSHVFTVPFSPVRASWG